MTRVRLHLASPDTASQDNEGYRHGKQSPSPYPPSSHLASPDTASLDSTHPNTALGSPRETESVCVDVDVCVGGGRRLCAGGDEAENGSVRVDKGGEHEVGGVVQAELSRVRLPTRVRKLKKCTELRLYIMALSSVVLRL